ncbi:hypothetical protein [Microbulbifer agarilyticus]|uniref:hypothetical protein n=1 Tax=Microbulbifer agarilyticus TaxID=260552 RepID=UPI001C97273D|nr:hypothetical protein [Microbulbifer agarilyticus]MBY6212677.1 hypothetical protein [Microbulbifer agarilyticus]MCA0894292.1 hypothetical protein [Microbulbifer agarilyticus]
MLFGNEQNPKGPSWSTARQIEKNLSGIKVSFVAPPYRPPIYGEGTMEGQAGSFDLNSPKVWTTLEREGRDGAMHISHEVEIWTSGWNFTGRPWLDGESLGRLLMQIELVEIRDQPVNNSLFQCSELTRFAQSYCTDGHIGHYHKGRAEDRNPFDLTQYQWPDYLFPINSQWLDLNGSEWLYFEVQPLLHLADRFYWLCPVGHQRCLRVRFMATRQLRNAGNPYREQRSPLDNYRRLMEKIMDSMTVELSEAARIEKSNHHNTDGDYPLPRCTEQLVREAKHTLYMWSGKGYTDKSQPKQGGDHRASKEDVAAFIDQRIQPRPLPGCLAIGSAFLPDNESDSTSSSQVSVRRLSTSG